MTFSVFYLIQVLIKRGTFSWKSHLNQTSGSKVMSNWRILRTTENRRNAFLFLAISHNQCSRLLTDSARSQHIWTNIKFDWWPELKALSHVNSLSKIAVLTKLHIASVAYWCIINRFMSSVIRTMIKMITIQAQWCANIGNVNL